MTLGSSNAAAQRAGLANLDWLVVRDLQNPKGEHEQHPHSKLQGVKRRRNNDEQRKNK